MKRRVYSDEELAYLRAECVCGHSRSFHQSPFHHGCTWGPLGGMSCEDGCRGFRRSMGEQR